MTICQLQMTSVLKDCAAPTSYFFFYCLTHWMIFNASGQNYLKISAEPETLFSPTVLMISYERAPS